MKNLSKDKPYLFRWRDHFSTEGFLDKEEPEIHEEIVFASVGFFVKEDTHYLHFARTVGNDFYADMMSVLKEHVLLVTPL